MQKLTRLHQKVAIVSDALMMGKIKLLLSNNFNPMQENHKLQRRKRKRGRVGCGERM